MKGKTLSLIMLLVISASLLTAGCDKKKTPTPSPEAEEPDTDPHLESEINKILSEGNSYFTIQIFRTGVSKIGSREWEISIDAQIPITEVYMDDRSFSGVGSGQYKMVGIVGEASDSFQRDVTYTIAGQFLGPPTCEIKLDVLEEIGKGEVCVTLPIVGTTCEEIPESEKEVYHFEPILIPFKNEGQDHDWEYVHTWTIGDTSWVDRIYVVDAGEAFELKLFEYLECVPTNLMPTNE